MREKIMVDVYDLLSFNEIRWVYYVCAGFIGRTTETVFLETDHTSGFLLHDYCAIIFTFQRLVCAPLCPFILQDDHGYVIPWQGEN